MYSMRVRSLLTILVVFVVLVGCAPKDTDDGASILNGTIIVGVRSDVPGFGSGLPNPTGFDIDLMNAIGVGLHKPVTSKPFTSADRESMLTTSNVHIVIAVFSITGLRNQHGIDFAGPYMVSPQALLVRAGENNIANKDGLAGKSVCTTVSTTSELVQIPGADMSSKASTVGSCVDQLRAGNVSAVLSDEVIFYGYTHTYPGEFKVILPGDIGQNQYYGIGLLKGHHADCLKLNDIISDYLRTQWRSDFQSQLPDAAAKYSGSNIKGDFESQFKPTGSDMTRLSCKL